MPITDIFIISLINLIFLIIGIFIGNKVKTPLKANFEPLHHIIDSVFPKKIKVFPKKDILPIDNQRLKDIQHEKDRAKS